MAKADEARERRRLIAKYEATGNEAFLRAAMCLRRDSAIMDRADALRILETRDPRGKGQPEIDDFDWLIEMAALMLCDGITANAAAWRVQPLAAPGNSPDATKGRLYRKFQDRPEYFKRQAEFIFKNRIKATRVAQKSRNKMK